jgi:hypothetical protein
MEQSNHPKVDGALVKTVAMVFYFCLLHNLLWRYLGVALELALIISATIVLLPTYWIPPKPPTSFARYAVWIESTVAAMVLGLAIAKLLRHYMPIQLACGLPVLLLPLPLYCLLSKLAPYTLRVSFIKWALGSLTLALMVAGAATVLPIAR